MKHVFIIGSKGIPANYGGFETFVDELTRRRTNTDIQYHVSCISNENKEFDYNGARCFSVKVPEIGPAKAILYDVLSLKNCISYIEKHDLNEVVVYILACRIGPFMSHYKKKLKALGVQVYVNPDGHEWKRSKWSYGVRKYWKLSESLMVKQSDLLICDSKGIEEYIHKEYQQYTPRTEFIAYGAEVKEITFKYAFLESEEWMQKFNLEPNSYYLVVGRFVPENNYEVMIREFMESNTQKDLVIITNVEENDFYKMLLEKTNFDKDSRIKFVGTVYNPDLLESIRSLAFAYIHGHEVGGTNPSLLEALAMTKVNLLLDVNFNKEVGEDGALYFSKKSKSLASLINQADNLSESMIKGLSENAKKRIISHYSWEKIVNDYEQVFLHSHNTNEVKR